MKLPQPIHSKRRAAFTMVEIAICLAIIGFALVAIVGVLPFGLRTQRDNREETIINQDATYFLDAIRSGAQGADMLTNYVEAITNTTVTVFANGDLSAPDITGYTRTVPAAAPLTNGARIIGLLSRPRYEPRPGGHTWSNYVVAYVRSISGPAVDKGANANSRDFAFHYKLVPEVIPAGWTALRNFNWNINGLSPAQIVGLTNQWNVLRNTASNLHEVRLLFRWPVLAGPDVANPNEPRIGSGRQTYRTLVGGRLDSVPIAQRPYYYFRPSLYQEVN